jgi:hypothetical protein
MFTRLSRMIANFRPTARLTTEMGISEFNAGRGTDHAAGTPDNVSQPKDRPRNVHDIEQLARAGGWSDIAKSLRTSDRLHRQGALSIA